MKIGGKNKMKIIQDNRDGSAEISFNENEVKIIQKNKKLIFEPSAMKALCNHLVNIAAQFNLNLNSLSMSLKTLLALAILNPALAGNCIASIFLCFSAFAACTRCHPSVNRK